MRCNPLLLLAALAVLPGGRAAAQPAPSPPAASQADAPPEEVRLRAVLAEALAQRLAPAERWDITLSATPEQKAVGFAPKLEARATNLKMPGGEALALLELTIEDLHVNLEDGSLTGAGRTTLDAHVRDEDLERMIKQKAGKKLRRLKIRFHNDRVITNAAVRVSFLTIPIFRLSRPQIGDDVVLAHTYQMKVSGFNLSQKLLKKLDDKVNPVINFKQFHFPVDIAAIDVGDGEMVVHLTADLNTEQEPQVSPRGRHGGRR